MEISCVVELRKVRKTSGKNTHGRSISGCIVRLSKRADDEAEMIEYTRSKVFATLRIRQKGSVQFCLKSFLEIFDKTYQ
jgi:hypothetical protein